MKLIKDKKEVKNLKSFMMHCKGAYVAKVIYKDGNRLQYNDLSIAELILKDGEVRLESNKHSKSTVIRIDEIEVLELVKLKDLFGLFITDPSLFSWQDFEDIKIACYLAMQKIDSMELEPGSRDKALSDRLEALRDRL